MRKEESDPCMKNLQIKDKEREILKRQNLLLTGINRIFKEAMTCDTEEEWGELCLSVAQEVTDSEFGFIGEITDEGLQDIAISNPGWDACKIINQKGHHKPPGNFKIHGLYGRVLKDGKSLFTNDPALHPDSIGLPPGHPPLECFLGVPLIHAGKTIGMVSVGNRKGGYTQKDVEILESLTLSIITALMHKRTEKALQASDKRCRALIETSSEALYRMSPDWTQMYQLHSRGFLVNTEKPSSTWLEEYIHPDDQPQVTAAIAEAIRTKSAFELEHRVRRQDGTLGWTFSRAVPLLNEKGEIEEWFGAASDVTERKQAEEVLKQSNLDLETANEELKAFNYSVSHDLRGPLRAIVGFSRLLEKKYGDRLKGQRRDYLYHIIKNAYRMNHLIDDLLRLSRIRKEAIERTEVDLSLMASGIIAELKESQPDREVAVEIDTGLTAQADQRLMAVVLSNLLRNAWKFTAKKEHPHIEFRALQKEGNVIYYVKDNGAGFNKKYAEKMFLPFHRLHSGNEFKGTGVGLAIVAWIIRCHRGKVWAEGEPGKGAAFFFTLGE